MRYQKGFVSIVVAVVVVLGLVAGGYILHTKKQQIKTNTEEHTEVIATNEKTESEPKDLESSVQKDTTSSACGTDSVCLIAAASECKATSGTFSFSGVSSPISSSLVASGTTKYTIQKGGSINNCVISSIPVKFSVGLTASGKAELVKQGISESEIETELQSMNAAMQYTIGKETICSGSGAALATFIADTKKGGSANISSTGSLNGSQSTITTSNNLKVTCKTS